MKWCHISPWNFYKINLFRDLYFYTWWWKWTEEIIFSSFFSFSPILDSLSNFVSYSGLGRRAYCLKRDERPVCRELNMNGVAPAFPGWAPDLVAEIGQESLLWSSNFSRSTRTVHWLEHTEEARLCRRCPSDSDVTVDCIPQSLSPNS